MTMVCVEQSQEHTFNVEWKGQFISTVDGHGMAGSRCIMHWGVGCKHRGFRVLGVQLAS